MRNAISPLALTAILFLSAAAYGAQQMPSGPGKEAFEKVCSGCHGPEQVTYEKLSKEQWADIVADMQARGATSSDTEISQIIDYLATNFGKKPPPQKIKVNKASAEELAKFLDVRSETIVQYRKKNGDFRNIGDLKKLPGIDAAKVDLRKDQIEF